MVQLRLMLLPGLTKTAFSPWITAAAAGIEENNLKVDFFMPEKIISNDL
jgi:hypothetical protein